MLTIFSKCHTIHICHIFAISVCLPQHATIVTARAVPIPLNRSANVAILLLVTYLVLAGPSATLRATAPLAQSRGSSVHVIPSGFFMANQSRATWNLFSNCSTSNKGSRQGEIQRNGKLTSMLTASRIRKCQIYLPNPRARAITVFSPGSAQVLCFYELESRSRNDKIPNLSVTIRKNRSELDAETSSRGHDWKDSPTSERPTGTWYRGRSNVRAIRGHCYAMVSKRQCCAISSQARPFTTGKIPSMARRGRWSCLLALSFAANRSWRHETPQCSYRCRWKAKDLRPWTGSSCGRRLFFVFFWRRVQQ